MPENQDKKKKKFNLYNLTYRDSQEKDAEAEDLTGNPNLPNFFKLLKRNFNRLLTVNLVYVLGNFPIFFVLLARGYVSQSSTAPYYMAYSALYGTMKFDPSPATASLLGIFGHQVPITVNTTWTYILMALSVLVVFTFGFVNVGITHILRSIVRGDPVFFWSDFLYAIKKNWKQALGFGILDAVLLALLANDLSFFFSRSSSMMMNIMFFLSIFMTVIYLCARFYAYLMMITFDLKFTKLLKNALIFSVLGIKRNILALLGIVALVVIDYLLFMLFIPIGIMLPFLFLIGIGSFMGAYAAWPNIKRYMIDPYYEEVEESDTQTTSA